MAKLPACQPFRIYRNAPLPETPIFRTNNLQAVNWENSLVDKISTYEKKFKKTYWRWRSSEQFVLPSDLHAWLQCLLYYVQIDTDGDELPDWSVLNNEKPARILYPFDPDIDDDGIENVFDSDPSQRGVLGVNKNSFPEHLKSSTKDVFHWQIALWKNFGILAIEHTANHSPYVLKEFYYLLKKLYPGKKAQWIGKIKYIYAFKNHDDQNDIAAYHTAAHAISIGGANTYTKKLTAKKRILFLSTIAHELGHAFLLETIKPNEFQDLCEKFGWRDVFARKKIDSLYSEILFREHPEWVSVDEAKNNNFVSEYSYTNAHEWFAEAFSDSLLLHLNILKTRSPNSFDHWLSDKLSSSLKLQQ